MKHDCCVVFVDASFRVGAPRREAGVIIFMGGPRFSFQVGAQAGSQKQDLKRLEDVLGVKIDGAISREIEGMDVRVSKIEQNMVEQFAHLKDVTLEKRLAEMSSRMQTEIGRALVIVVKMVFGKVLVEM